MSRPAHFSLYFVCSQERKRKKLIPHPPIPFFPFSLQQDSSVHGVPQARVLELPCLSLGDLPNTEIEPASLMSPALAAMFFTTRATWEAYLLYLEKLMTVTSLDIPK